MLPIFSGETTANIAGIIQGQGQGELTQRGVQQAAQLGARLATYPPYQAIYCSDLARTRSTLEHIVGAAKQAGVELASSSATVSFTSSLRERAAGCHEGSRYGTSDKAARERGIDPRAYRAEGGGESWQDVEVRASEFLMKLLEDWSAKNLTEDTRVLLVAHGGCDLLASLFRARTALLLPRSSLLSHMLARRGLHWLLHGRAKATPRAPPGSQAPLRQ